MLKHQKAGQKSACDHRPFPRALSLAHYCKGHEPPILLSPPFSSPVNLALQVLKVVKTTKDVDNKKRNIDELILL